MSLWSVWVLVVGLLVASVALQVGGEGGEWIVHLYILPAVVMTLIEFHFIPVGKRIKPQ